MKNAIGKIVALLLIFLLLTSCVYSEDSNQPSSDNTTPLNDVNQVTFPNFSTEELSVLLSGISQNTLFELNIDKDTILNNPLGAPFFNLMDEETWGLSLVGAVKDEDIYLYSHYHNGMVVYYKGNLVYFNDWKPIMTVGVYPQILYNDLNGDGKKDLAVITPKFSTLGVSIDNLYILSFDDEGDYTLTYLLGEEMNKWMLESMGFETMENSDTFRFYFRDQCYIVKSLADEHMGNLIDVSLSSIANFYFESNLINASLAVGGVYENTAPYPLPFGNITATVSPFEDSLLLDNYSFTTYE